MDFYLFLFYYILFRYNNNCGMKIQNVITPILTKMS